jgi:hypothetical protein
MQNNSTDQEDFMAEKSIESRRRRRNRRIRLNGKFLAYIPAETAFRRLEQEMNDFTRWILMARLHS